VWDEEVKVSGMSEQNNQAGDNALPAPSQANGGVSRRALIRAGMSAVPVMAALKTEMVLATTSSTTTVRPSSFASFVINKCSVAPGRKTTGNYVALKDCRARCYNSTSKTGIRYFHNWDSRSSHCAQTYYSSRSTYVPKTVELTTWFTTTISTSSVAAMHAQKRLAVYCAAAYISSQVHLGNSYLTSAQIKAIWDGNGEWYPMAGVKWTQADTLAYFGRVYGVSGAFDACLTSGSGGTTSGGC
jgi:hypothetical protein